MELDTDLVLSQLQIQVLSNAFKGFPEIVEKNPEKAKIYADIVMAGPYDVSALRNYVADEFVRLGLCSEDGTFVKRYRKGEV